MSLLGTGTERCLLASRLESVTLEDTLEGLGGRALAGAATATNGTRASSGGGHGRDSGVSSGCRHFVYYARNFNTERRKVKMDPLGIIAIVGIAATALVLAYYCKKKSDFGTLKMTKSSSTDKLTEMVRSEDPIQVS